MPLGTSVPFGALRSEDVERIVALLAEELRPDSKRIVVLIPDLTRSGPIPLLFRLLADSLARRAARLDFLIALGTHPPLGEVSIERLVAMSVAERARRYPNVSVLNHQWGSPGTLARIGEISAAEVAESTEGLLSESVDIVVNRRVLEGADWILICGPVFPHEVVGFSGGNKYLFPGVSGDKFLQFFHWLGAIITNPRVNGNQWTPVRRLIDRAARLIPVPRKAICFVVDPCSVLGPGGGRTGAESGGRESSGQDPTGLAAIFSGDVEEAWAAAVEVSRERHIRYLDRPFRRVLAQAPAMYDDLWVGGKCMYKLEPVLADGAELVIFAPHIREVSFTHGRVLDEIGYHTRDYFTAQWDRFRHYPWGVVAHSTHVRGIGTYEAGVERPRVEVTLATGIPESRCRRINLGYRDPASIRVEEWQGRENEGILCVPHAGEVLYRLKDPPEWARP